MLRHALCSFLLCCGVALSAADVPVEGWLAKADSLRTIGLDAASLDLLKSAQHEFEANGDPCSSARWPSAVHESTPIGRTPPCGLALTEAIRFSEQCPGLAERVGRLLSLRPALTRASGRRRAPCFWVWHE